MQDQDDKLELDDDLDDLLLDDDFGDDLDLDLDDDLMDDLPEELMEPEVQPDPNVLQSPAKKSLPLNFNTMVIAGAVVVGAIVMVTQVMGDKQKQAASQQQRFVSSLGLKGATETLVEPSQEETGISGVRQQEANVTQEQNNTGGFLDENAPDFVENDLVEIVEPDLPMPTPISEENAHAVENENSIVDSLEFLTETDVDDVKLIDQTPNRGVIDPLPNNTVVETVEVASPSEPDLMPDVESVVPDPIEEPVQASHNNADVLNRIDGKLSSFSDRFETLENKIESYEEASSQRMAVIEGAMDDLERQVKRKSVVQAPSKPSERQKSVSVKQSKSAPSVQWELKAAQPGKAWISQKGKSDIRPVVVGENVAGLGRVQSISMSDNQWVIIGSAGRISQ